MNFPWRTALFISLALNIVIVSVAIGAFASGARLQRPAPESTTELRFSGQRAFLRALPPEDRRQLRRDIAAELIAMREQRAASRQARLALYEAARAEPYDAERVRAAFAAVRAADAALLAGVHDALADGFGEVDPASRAAALDAMERERPSSGEPAIDAPDRAPLLDDEGRAERRERIRERLRERRERREQ